MPQFVCDLLRENIGQKALAFDKRHAAVKPEMRLACHVRIAGKAFISRKVGNQEEI
jgi:hypothetical protein